MMMDYSQGYDNFLSQHYYRKSLPALIRLKLYAPDVPQNLLIYQLVSDSMDNILDNHPLYRPPSLQFLRNADNRLDFWLDVLDLEVKTQVVDIIKDFLDVYEQEAETK